MEDRLKEIIISITNRCNLRCVMCQIPLMQNNEEMATKELEGLISDAANLHPNSIVFSGGEPLLRKDIFELIAFANKHRINTCLTSNGTLVNDEIAKRLNISGIGVVNISIEGSESIHDSLRGKGSFAKAFGALEYLSKYKIETTIATVVCRQNYKTLPYIMKLAHQFGVTTVKFQPFSEIFLIKKEEGKDFFTSRNTLGEIKQSIDKVIGFSKEYKITTNPSNYLYSIPIYLCGLWQTHLHDSCSALFSSCPISAEGDVHLCWVLSDRLLGNVKKSKLSKIWNSNEHKRLRQLTIEEGCPGCLMSCYDYNLGKYGLGQLLPLKAKKFKDPKFYKRLYYRIYQYLIYIFGKIINRIANLGISKKRSGLDTAQALEEIKVAKDMLKRELKILKEYE